MDLTSVSHPARPPRTFDWTARLLLVAGIAWFEVWGALGMAGSLAAGPYLRCMECSEPANLTAWLGAWFALLAAVPVGMLVLVRVIASRSRFAPVGWIALVVLLSLPVLAAAVAADEFRLGIAAFWTGWPLAAVALAGRRSGFRTGGRPGRAAEA